jgi:hypothetical protein
MTMNNMGKVEIGSPIWIEKQRAICDAATPGEWHYIDNGFDGYVESDSGVEIFGGEPCEGRIEPDDPNAAFIIAAKAGYRAALDALEASNAREAEKDATIARLTAERDAAVADLSYLAEGHSHCDICAHDDDGYDAITPPHCKYVGGHCFRWRGPCAENTDNGGENK